MEMKRTQKTKPSLWRRAVSGAMPGKYRQGAEGQALVEFALCLPFMIMLFVVLVELGFLIRSHMTVTAAVREGVRVASARGNADPYVFAGTITSTVTGGNEVNRKVGADGDLVLVQNVNTALDKERQSVKMLMTYRADITENTATNRVTDPETGASVAVTNNVGLHGLGGIYGVYYNPAVSLKPFQEVFSYTLRVTNGITETWFVPVVLTQARCDAIYANMEPAKVPDLPTYSGNTYGDTNTFCGDGAATPINRSLPLGKKVGTVDNVTQINNKPRYSGGSTCNIPTSTGYTSQTEYQQAIQCWRYNFAPWYPSLRRAIDVGQTAGTGQPNSSGYFNRQAELAANFGSTNESSPRSVDYLGVQINYEHKWFLTFFPGSLSLTDKAVKPMEVIGGGFNAP